MRTVSPPRLRPFLLALACILSMTACNGQSMLRSTAPTVKPTPPEIRCAQKTIDPQIPKAPRRDEWTEWLPSLDANKPGAARMSRSAATWIAEVLGVVEVLRSVRKEEHNCLDGLEKKGLITQ